MCRIFITIVTVLSGLCIFLFCGDTPNNPFSPENAKISLLLMSSNYQQSDTAVTDTVGKTIRLGLCLFLTEYFDSTVVSVSVSSKIDTTIICREKDKSIDTAYYDLVFATSGTRAVSATAYIGKEIRQANAIIHVLARPQPNRKPELTVTGSRTISAGQACTLWVSADDPDSGQSVTIDTLRCPHGSTFSDTIFTWQPTMADTGIDTVIFIARDNGTPPLIDTEVVSITVTQLKVNHPPQWNDDTISLTGIVGWSVSLTLAGRCSDPDNDTLIFALLAGAPDRDTVLSGVYSFTPAHEGIFYPRVVARDPQMLSDTLVIKLTINPADTTPPTLHRISPADDSITISASGYQVRVSATDSSGILSVRCFKDADSIPVTRSDTVYSAAVSGILQNQYVKITFVAIDSSLNANACTLSVYIKRDSTMLDSEGPVIIQKSGPAGGSVITDSIIAITDSIIDPSGIDSAYWTLNGVRAGSMSPASGSTTNYSLRDTLTKYRLNRLVIHAIDRSTRRNRDSAVVELDYNLPPAINDTLVATDRNTPKTWALNAESRDNDSLSWSRLSSPSPLSGTVTGALPSITFTPATNWSGTDSFYIRVTDGYWSDTAKIKITVVDVPVAPKIDTQPKSLTRVAGQSAEFSVVINSDANPAPTYQWKLNGTNIPGANAHSYSIGAVAVEDSGSYTVTVTNGVGTVTSLPALLTVQYAPVITTQPQSQTLNLGQSVTFSIAARGNPAPTYQWKKNGAAIPGQTNASYAISSPGVEDSGRYTVTISNGVGSVNSDTSNFFAEFKSVVASYLHSLFLKTDGRLFGCGANNSGQLGDGTGEDKHTPVLLALNVQSIAAGNTHSLIIKNDNTLWGCGTNTEGELGDGTQTDRFSFIQIRTNIRQMSGGVMHTLMLTTNDILFACGSNYYGQLGDGTRTDRYSPVQIMTGINNASAGSTHSLILDNGGSLKGCGEARSGQLGTSPSNYDSIPIQISTNIQGMSGGNSYSLILTVDGILLSCGYNNFGQLGDGTSDSKHTLVQVMTDVKNIDAGENHTLILKNDGSLWGCGLNLDGELGDGTATDQLTPVRIMEDVKYFSAGASHSLVIKTDGTLWAFGDNTYGQLGDGTTQKRYAPVNISF